MRYFVAGSLFLAVLAQADRSVTTKIPDTTPDDAFEVPSDFFGFGWESGLVPHYNDQVSDISVRAVKVIGKNMDKDPVIRIGGTSGDHIYYKPDQKAAATCDSGSRCRKNSKDVFYIGPSYFDTLSLFKKSTTSSMTIQAPMGPHMPVNYSLAYVQEAYKALGADRVAAIALGNEPNWYNDTNGQHISAQEYVDQAVKLKAELIDMLKGDNPPVFQVGEIASQAVHNDNNPFRITEVVNQGIKENGGAKYAAEHYYQLTDSYHDKSKYTPEMLGEKLMNHDSIKNQLKHYTKDVAFLRKNNLSLTISEVGSALGISPPWFGAGFGAAIWAVDFHLAAMAGGVSQICNTQEPAATHSFWVPDNTGNNNTYGPAVQGVFVAAAFITDFVGKTGSLGKVHEIGPFDDGRVTGYVSYSLESSKPQRIALVNMKEYNEDSGDTREKASVTLDVGDFKSAKVRRMTSKFGSPARGFDLGGEKEVVTHAGQQYSYAKNKLVDPYPTKPTEESETVDDGKLTVSLQDTEAVVIELQGKATNGANVVAPNSASYSVFYFALFYLCYHYVL
ncbi:hypothetical protein N7512_007866 [Penicillium capsulatum]|nr:hypothetical protein N7512_007866 [Penicillium capsulatum]